MKTYKNVEIENVRTAEGDRYEVKIGNVVEHFKSLKDAKSYIDAYSVAWSVIKDYEQKDGSFKYVDMKRKIYATSAKHAAEIMMSRLGENWEATRLGLGWEDGDRFDVADATGEANHGYIVTRD